MPSNRQADLTERNMREGREDWECALYGVTKVRHQMSRTTALYAMLNCAEEMEQAAQAEERMSLRSNEISQSTFIYQFEQLSDLGCVQLFRFCRRDFNRLVAHIGWPAYRTKTKRNGYRVDPFLATGVLLRRLATPDRWCDLELLFGKFSAQLAEIFREVLQCFVQRHDQLITAPMNHSFMSSRVPVYAQAIHSKIGCLRNCIGYIDGTVIRIARPGGPDMLQRVVYNGHKRVHALKFQAVTTPDGLCLHLFGPEVGRRHDMFLYEQSHMDDMLEEVMVLDGRQFVIYGDSGYHPRPYVEVPFAGANLTDVERAFNGAMSKGRVTVEWYFKEVKQFWGILDSKRKLRVREGPVGLAYRAGVLLTNMRNCISPNQISQYFRCSPPTLEEYISHKD